MNCGNGSQCLQTKIPNLPEICACSDGTYTNSTCAEIDLEDENNITSINTHGLSEWYSVDWFDSFLFFLIFLARRLIAVCEHSFCGDAGVCIIIDTAFGCICPDGGIMSRCISNIDTGLRK